MNRFYLIVTIVSVFMKIASSSSITKQKNYQESILNQNGLMEENQFLDENFFNSGLKPKEEIKNVKILDGKWKQIDDSARNIKKRQAEKPHTETINSLDNDFSTNNASTADKDLNTSEESEISEANSKDYLTTDSKDEDIYEKTDAEDKDLNIGDAPGTISTVDKKTTSEIETTPKSTAATLPTTTQSTKITEKPTTTTQKEKEACPECSNNNLVLILFVCFTLLIFLIVILVVCIIMVKRKKISLGQVVGFRKRGNEDKKTESVVLIDASQIENQNNPSHVDEPEPKASNANLSDKSPIDDPTSPECNPLETTDETFVASPEGNVLTTTNEGIVAVAEEMPKNDENKSIIESSQNQSDPIQTGAASGMEPIKDQADVPQEAQVNSIEPQDGKESAPQEILQDVI